MLPLKVRDLRLASGAFYRAVQIKIIHPGVEMRAEKALPFPSKIEPAC